MREEQKEAVIIRVSACFNVSNVLHLNPFRFRVNQEEHLRRFHSLEYLPLYCLNVNRPMVFHVKYNIFIGKNKETSINS